MECLVQRHIVVRFNRKTRKIYINRPNFAGGNRVYDWDDVVASVDPDDRVVTRQRKREILMLFFFKQRTGAEYHDVVFLGAPLRSDHELYALWEYIRRYMEEGPESLPKPRCIPNFPWPWRSLLAPWSFLENKWAAAPWSPGMVALVVIASVNAIEVCPDFITSDCPVFISTLSSEQVQGRVRARPPSWQVWSPSQLVVCPSVDSFRL